MNHSYGASLVSIPSDVIHQHIIPFLSRADLIILSVTCTKMQKLFSKWMLCFGEKLLSKAQFQRHLLNEMFRRGSFAQLVWFQETLKYFSMPETNQNLTIIYALGGDWQFFVTRFLLTLIYLLRRKLGTSSCASWSRL